MNYLMLGIICIAGVHSAADDLHLHLNFSGVQKDLPNTPVGSGKETDDYSDHPRTSSEGEVEDFTNETGIIKAACFRGGVLLVVTRKGHIMQGTNKGPYRSFKIPVGSKEIGIECKMWNNVDNGGEYGLVASGSIWNMDDIFTDKSWLCSIFSSRYVKFYPAHDGISFSSRSNHDKQPPHGIYAHAKSIWGPMPVRRAYCKKTLQKPYMPPNHFEGSCFNGRMPVLRGRIDLLPRIEAKENTMYDKEFYFTPELCFKYCKILKEDSGVTACQYKNGLRTSGHHRSNVFSCYAITENVDSAFGSFEETGEICYILPKGADRCGEFRPCEVCEYDDCSKSELCHWDKRRWSTLTGKDQKSIGKCETGGLQCKPCGICGEEECIKEEERSKECFWDDDGSRSGQEVCRHRDWLCKRDCKECKHYYGDRKWGCERDERCSWNAYDRTCSKKKWP